MINMNLPINLICSECGGDIDEEECVICEDCPCIEEEIGEEE